MCIRDSTIFGPTIPLRLAASRESPEALTGQERHRPADPWRRPRPCAEFPNERAQESPEGEPQAASLRARGRRGSRGAVLSAEGIRSARGLRGCAGFRPPTGGRKRLRPRVRARPDARRGTRLRRGARRTERLSVLRVAHADAPADADSDADAGPAGQPAVRRSDVDPADSDFHAHRPARHSVQGPRHFRVSRRADRVARRGRPDHQRPRGRRHRRPLQDPQDQPRVRRLRLNRSPARDHPTHSDPAPVRREIEGLRMTTTRNARASRHFPRRPGVAAALVLALAASSCASSRAFRDGEREEQRKHWDLAVLDYENALAADPNDATARVALQRARFQAAQAHFERGRLHRSAGQLDLAVAELEVSLSLDPTNDSAQQELRKAKADVETRSREIAGGTPVEQAKAKTRGARAAPPMLNPSSTKPIDVAFAPDTTIKKIYAALGAAAGINIIYDPQLKDDKFTLDLRGMTFQKALETAMRQAGHFYKVIDEKTILIAQDTQQNRKEYEDQVIRTFFLSNGDVKDVSAMVRSILDLRRLGTIPSLNAIIIRDTADKVAVAERLIEVNDKAKSEVVVDVELLQVNTTNDLNLGLSLPNTETATVVQPAAAGGVATATSLPWNAIKGLGINDLMFTIPTITYNFLKQNTDAEVLAKPQLRIAEGEKAQLVI